MKNKIIQTEKTSEDKKITRKEAIKKTGIVALTTASVLFLSPKKSAAASDLPSTPGSGW